MDAVQNTLVHLMEYTGTFESESHKKSWLLKVGVNECRQLHRQWWRRKVTADESLIDMEKAGVQTSDVWENRTPVFAVRGRRLNPLTNKPYLFFLCL